MKFFSIYTHLNTTPTFIAKKMNYVEVEDAVHELACEC